MPYKSIQAEITDIDASKGIIEGYASIFGVIDSDKDMIMPGSYKKTLQENGRRVKHLWQHNPLFPLAKPDDLQEDHRGLKFRSTIAHTSYGRDVIKLYTAGVIDEHSVGIRFSSGHSTKKSGYTERTEVALWEYSSVTWGANEHALVTSVKSLSKEEVIKKMDAVYKALRNGDYEHEVIFEQLDIYHNQLKEMVSDLIGNTQAAEEAPEPPTETEHNDNDLVIRERMKSIANILIIK